MERQRWEDSVVLLRKVRLMENILSFLVFHQQRFPARASFVTSD